MAKGVFVIAEQRDGALRKVSFELASAARKLADQSFYRKRTEWVSSCAMARSRWSVSGGSHAAMWSGHSMARQ